MAKWIFRPWREGDAFVMKAADAAEVYASHALTPVEAITLSVKYSTRAEAILFNHRVEAAWGYSEIMPEVAVPWLLSSETLVRDARQLVREGRRIIRNLKGRYTMLYNYVDARNQASLDWLCAIGFYPQDRVPHYGVAKLPFILMVA